MAENESTKPDITPPNPAIREYDRESSYIATTGFAKGAKVRYEIIWTVPKTDEESMNRYGVSLTDLICAGVQILSHRPDYKTVLDADEYTTARHEAVQKMADDYKVGSRTPGKTAQVKADAVIGRKASESAKALGFSSIEEALEFASKAKKKSKNRLTKH